MRERLSRGKWTDNDEGEFVYGIPVEGEPLLGMGKRTYIITKPGVQWVDGVYMTYDECIEVDPKTIGDYTGLTDRNNKMIFEGDIINYKGALAKVIYSTENAGFYALFSSWDTGLRALSAGKYVSVIGNIYDNPELMKGGNDNG